MHSNNLIFHVRYFPYQTKAIKRKYKIAMVIYILCLDFDRYAFLLYLHLRDKNLALKMAHLIINS